MKIKCPHCKSKRPNISKNGFFKRKSDSKTIQKYRCKHCRKEFSNATFSDCYRQKKRRLNFHIRKELCSSTSLRRIALNYNISRTTVKRKLEFLAQKAHISHTKWLKEHKKNFKLGFDPLFSINHVFAMMRDNVKRLSRKTWCNTKKKELLEKHIHIYVDFHNCVLTWFYQQDCGPVSEASDVYIFLWLLKFTLWNYSI